MPDNQVMFIAGSALAVISLIMVVMLGATTLQQVQVAAQPPTANQINNESSVFVFGVPNTLLYGPVAGVQRLGNATNGGVVQVLEAGNYTTSLNTVSLAEAFVYNLSVNSTMNVTVNTTVGQITRIVRIINASNGAEMGIGNLTVTGNVGKYDTINVTIGATANDARNRILNVSYAYSRYNGTLINVTYTYNTFGADYNITQTGLQSMAQFGGFFNVIVIVIIFAGLMGIFAYFTMARKNSF